MGIDVRVNDDKIHNDRICKQFLEICRDFPSNTYIIFVLIEQERIILT